MVMRRLIEEAEAKGAPAGSNLELLVEEILETAGFRRLERQLPILRRRRLHRAGRLRVTSDGASPSRSTATGFTAASWTGCSTTGSPPDWNEPGWAGVRITEPEIWHARSDLVTRLVNILGATHHLIAESQPDGPHAA